jgi:hypothetical protein
MIYLQKGQQNVLVLNINNNTTTDFATYDLVFTHVMSKEEKTYTIDTSDALEYTSNIRYCSIVLNLSIDDLNYEGEYDLKIYGDGADLVFQGISILEGTVEEPAFTEYISPNEVNENYIYIS